MCVFHSSQFTFMTRNQAAQPPNIIVDTKSGGNSAPDLALLRLDDPCCNK